MPQLAEDEQKTTINGFKETAKFSNCLCVVEEKHVRIILPEQRDYYGREDSIQNVTRKEKKLTILHRSAISRNGPLLSKVLVGDEAFSLQENLLPPYRGKNSP
ncbi:hypothetical protein EVAR_64603_1 [Eumeta japonica]|uniref:DDE Tnp4 domain-containing protein n=1 Tax=Eumeta variegata TaxID=151549 RepID=A0A4C1ZBN5_EUMVA|nr:hypothetical protein EVAR_64603_1 [Eumeta japonica]